MQKPTNRDLKIIIGIALAFMAIGFGISRYTQPKPIEKLSVDVTKFEHTIDSIIFAKKKDSLIINFQYKVIDSLNKSLKDKNQYDNETAKIKKFTSSSRIAWRDSVAIAEKLR